MLNRKLFEGMQKQIGLLRTMSPAEKAEFKGAVSELLSLADRGVYFNSSQALQDFQDVVVRHQRILTGDANPFPDMTSSSPHFLTWNPDTIATDEFSHRAVLQMAALGRVMVELVDASLPNLQAVARTTSTNNGVVFTAPFGGLDRITDFNHPFSPLLPYEYCKHLWTSARELVNSKLDKDIELETNKLLDAQIMFNDNINTDDDNDTKQLDNLLRSLGDMKRHLEKRKEIAHDNSDILDPDSLTPLKTRTDAMERMLEDDKMSALKIAQAYVKSQLDKIVSSIVTDYSQQTLNTQKSDFDVLKDQTAGISKAIELARSAGASDAEILDLQENQYVADIVVAQTQAQYLSKFATHTLDEINAEIAQLEALSTRKTGKHAAALENLFVLKDNLLKGIDVQRKSVLDEMNRLALLKPKAKALLNLKSVIDEADAKFVAIRKALGPLEKIRELFNFPQTKHLDKGNTFIRHDVDTSAYQSEYVSRENLIAGTVATAGTRSRGPVYPGLNPSALSLGTPQGTQATFQHKTLRSGDIVRSVQKLSDGFEAVIVRDSKGVVTDATPVDPNRPLTTQESAEKVLKMATEALQDYKEGSGDLVIKGRPPQLCSVMEANMLLATLLILKEKVPGMKNVGIVSQVSQCEVPKKDGMLKGFFSKPTTDFIEAQLDEAMRTAVDSEAKVVTQFRASLDAHLTVSEAGIDAILAKKTAFKDRLQAAQILEDKALKEDDEVDINMKKLPPPRP